MAAYRLYFLDSHNAIQARQDFAADNDSDARIIGELLCQACTDCYQGYELWQAARRIAREIGIPMGVPAVVGIGRELQERVLTVQESLLDSHWRAAQSATLLAATERLRDHLDGSGTATLTHQDLMRYIGAATGSDMLSLQLVEGAQLRLRGSRGFDRLFDDYFAVVEHDDCACGVAFKSASQTVVPAIDTSPIYAGRQSLEMLRRHGVASCVSTPFLGGDGSITGMFSILRSAIWNPMERELAQLREIAKDIAAAMADPLSAAARRLRALV